MAEKHIHRTLDFNKLSRPTLAWGYSGPPGNHTTVNRDRPLPILRIRHCYVCIVVNVFVISMSV